MIKIKWRPYLSVLKFCQNVTGLYLTTLSLEKVITKFVLYAILHYVGMSWIICSNKEMKYEIDERNHQDWLKKRPCYNTAICSRLHGSMFEDIITHARNDRNNILYYLVAHDKKLPDYEYEDRSIGDRIIHNHMTTKALE